MNTIGMTPVIKSVELPNQAKLQYVEQGDPSGIPLLCLHAQQSA